MTSLFTAILLTAGIMSNGAVISDPVPAVINENMQIILPEDQPLAEVYVIDISGLKFTEASEANQFFGMFTENVVHYVVDFDSRTVNIYLQDVMSPSWDLGKWNEYFATRSGKMQVVYDSM